jgi:hypothetical protein
MNIRDLRLARWKNDEKRQLCSVNLGLNAAHNGEADGEAAGEAPEAGQAEREGEDATEAADEGFQVLDNGLNGGVA